MLKILRLRTSKATFRFDPVSLIARGMFELLFLSATVEPRSYEEPGLVEENVDVSSGFLMQKL
jgi:hypothetical protein